MLPDETRQKAILNEAMDQIYSELTRTTPAQVTRAPVMGRGGPGLPTLESVSVHWNRELSGGTG